MPMSLAHETRRFASEDYPIARLVDPEKPYNYICNQ
jgi:hypothetical protein